MADRKYAVAFDGELIEGITGIDVRARLARIWPSLSASQIDALMGSRNATLKLFAERDVADRFVGFMRQAGMVCWLRLLRPGEESTAVLAELEWSVADADALLVAANTPPPVAPRRVAVPRVATSPKVMTGAIVLVAATAIAWLAVDHGPKKRRTIAPVESSVAESAAPASVEPESPTIAAAAAPETPLPTSSKSKTLLVPEPILVSAATPRSAPKDSPPQAAEAAKLESAAPAKMEKAPASAPPVVYAAPAATQPAASQMVAMNQSAATAPAPLPKPAEVITAPTYDKAKVAQPRYPLQAYRNHEQGEVLLNVVVGSDGKPRKVSVDKTSGSSALDRAAVDAVKGWQFTPGTRNGVAQEAARQVAVGFKLEE